MPWGLNMGVAGASLATAISKWVSFIILIYPYVTRRSLLRLSIRNFRPKWEIFSEIIAVGSSSMFRSGLAVVSAIMLNDLAGNISDSVLAAVGVCNKVMMFPFSIILGFGSGFQPVAGFNWGAKRFDRVEESYRFCSKVALIGSLIMAALVGFFADTFVVLFAGADAEMRRIGVICMVSQCIALPIHAWVAIVNMLCAGLGNAKGALILSTSRQGTCFLPILYPLAWDFGAIGIAVVQALADILSLVLAIPILRKTRKAVNEAEAAWLAEQKQ
jgi:Na+-driven multidrug efflux pump